jgi:hypothetical protein
VVDLLLWLAASAAVAAGLLLQLQLLQTGKLL